MKQQQFMGRWMPEGPEHHELYLGEYYDSLAWRTRLADPDWGYEEWRRPRNNYSSTDMKAPTAVSPIVGQCSPLGDDRSLASVSRVFLPSQLFVREAKLRWSGRPGAWIDESGAVVAVDPSAGQTQDGCLLVRRTFLDLFLKRSGYALLWTILGEKLVFNWDNRYPRLEISGAAWYRGQRLDIALAGHYDDRS
jgi:hypothetical protein